VNDDISYSFENEERLYRLRGTPGRQMRTLSVERVIDAFMMRISCALDADQVRRNKTMPAKNFEVFAYSGNAHATPLSKRHS
jgi:hypothetical protein